MNDTPGPIYIDDVLGYLRRENDHAIVGSVHIPIDEYGRLFAAAPRLLAACEAVINWFSPPHEGDCYRGDEACERCSLIYQVTDAIREARGSYE